MPGKPPAFPFYAADFRNDGNVILMTTEEIGAYLLLLIFQWIEGYLPTDLEELAVIAKMPFDRFEKSWKRRIEVSFKLLQEKNVFINKRLEIEREKLLAKQEGQKKGGKNSAHKRKKRKALTPEQLPASNLPSNLPTNLQVTSSQLEGDLNESDLSEKVPIYINNNNSNKGGTGGKPKKNGTRIPEDFALTDEMIEWAKEKTPHIDPYLQTAQFKDTYATATGRNAVGLLWDAKWRTWMRNQEQWFLERNPGAGLPSQQKPKTDFELAYEAEMQAENRRRVAQARKN